jgi:hypothetical protein
MTAHMPGGETRREPLVSLSLHDKTLFEVLNAISAAAGHVSWVVTYRSSTPTAETAGIAFLAGDTHYLAVPPFDGSYTPTRENSR